jgi:LAO/AO transport system kinase
MESYRATMSDSGELVGRRAEQARAWLWGEVSANLVDALKADPEVKKQLHEVEQLLTPLAAARRLIAAFIDGGGASP